MGLILTLLKALPLWVYPMVALALWGAQGHWEYSHLVAKDLAAELKESQQHESALETQRLATQARDSDRSNIESELAAAVHRTVNSSVSLAHRLRVHAAAVSPAASAAISTCRLDATPGDVISDATRDDLTALATAADQQRNQITALQEWVEKECK